MNVKCAFLNGIINEEVFVKPPGFESSLWNQASTSCLRKSRHHLFSKNYDSHFIIVQKEFEMSMMGELKFFLRLQIKQEDDEIYIH
ncbi:hypothetical protein CR513_42328, partial [Mucuna pruriens]